MLRHMGVWKLTVTGPRALLDVYYGEVEVEGLGGDDKFDRNNLEYDACQEVAKGLGYKSYDDLPEQYTPITFGEPELSTNMYVTPEGAQQWFVGVYSVGRSYGGPEEGGWWYDTGELVQQTAVNSYDEAEEVRQRLYDGEFPDTGKSSSVLGGDDFRIAIGIEPHAKSFPDTKPRYE
jgi:hypothetical protein